MALLPLFPIKDAAIMQWQARWKALLDPLLKDRVADTPSPNLIISKGCGTYTVTTTGVTQIPNLSVIIKTQGKPVQISLQSDTLSSDPGSASSLILANPSPTAPGAVYDGSFILYRDGAAIAFSDVIFFESTSVNDFELAVPAVFFYLDNQPTGEYTYSLSLGNGQFSATPGFLSLQGVRLMAQELGV